MRQRNVRDRHNSAAVQERNAEALEMDRRDFPLSPEQERAAMLLALAKKEVKSWWPWSACLRQARLEVADLGIAS